MSTPIKPKTSGGEFIEHIPGTFSAICADVYVQHDKNNFYGKPRDNDRPDEIDTRETIENVYLVFLTSHKMPNGDPSYVRARFTNTWGGSSKPSNLFKFIKGWFPSAKPEQIHDMDLNNLVGKKAWLTVEQNDKGYAKASSASALPTGAEVVVIPDKFKRKEERQQAQAAPAPPAMPPQAPLPTHIPDFIGGNDDQLPF